MGLVDELVADKVQLLARAEVSIFGGGFQQHLLDSGGRDSTHRSQRGMGFAQ
jgi:hypothetical protein